VKRRGFLGAMLAVLAAPTILARVAMDVAKGVPFRRMRMRWTIGKEIHYPPWSSPDYEDVLIKSMGEVIARDLEKQIMEDMPVTATATAIKWERL